MRRDERTEAAIEGILKSGRETRKSTPRWLWIAALLCGALGVTGFAISMLADGDPTHSSAVQRRPPELPGFFSGLLIGGAGGIVIGFAIGRQRPSHSSRNNP